LTEPLQISGTVTKDKRIMMSTLIIKCSIQTNPMAGPLPQNSNFLVYDVATKFVTIRHLAFMLIRFAH